MPSKQIPVSYEFFKKHTTNHEELVNQIFKSKSARNPEMYEIYKNSKSNREKALKQYYEAFYLNPKIRENYHICLKPVPKHIKDKLLQIPPIIINDSDDDEPTIGEGLNKENHKSVCNDLTGPSVNKRSNQINDGPSSKRPKCKNVPTKVDMEADDQNQQAQQLPTTSKVVNMSDLEYEDLLAYEHCCPVQSKDFQKYTNIVELISDSCRRRLCDTSKAAHLLHKFYLKFYLQPDIRSKTVCDDIKVNDDCPADIKAKIFEIPTNICLKDDIPAENMVNTVKDPNQQKNKDDIPHENLDNQQNNKLLPVSYEQFKSSAYFEEHVEKLLKSKSKGNENTYQELKNSAEDKETAFREYYEAYYLRPEIRETMPIRFRAVPRALKDKLLQIPTQADLLVNNNIPAPNSPAEQLPSTSKGVNMTELKYKDLIAYEHCCPVQLKEFQKYTNIVELLSESCRKNYGDTSMLADHLHRIYLKFYLTPGMRSEIKYRKIKVNDDCPADIKAKILEIPTNICLKQIPAENMDNTVKDQNQQKNKDDIPHENLITTAEDPNQQKEKLLPVSYEQFKSSAYFEEHVDKLIKSSKGNENMYQELKNSAEAKETAFREYYESYYLRPEIREIMPIRFRAVPRALKEKLLQIPIQADLLVNNNIPAPNTAATNGEGLNKENHKSVCNDLSGPSVNKRSNQINDGPSSKRPKLNNVPAKVDMEADDQNQQAEKLPTTSKGVNISDLEYEDLLAYEHCCPVQSKDFQKYTNIVELISESCRRRLGDTSKAAHLLHKFYLKFYLQPDIRSKTVCDDIKVNDDCPADIKAKIFEIPTNICLKDDIPAENMDNTVKDPNQQKNKDDIPHENLDNQQNNNLLPVSYEQFKSSAYFEEHVDKLIKSKSNGNEHMYQELKISAEAKETAFREYYEAYYLRPEIRETMPIRFRAVPRALKDKLLQVPIQADLLQNNNIPAPNSPDAIIPDVNQKSSKQSIIILENVLLTKDKSMLRSNISTTTTTERTLDSTEDTNNTVNNTVIHQISKPVIETCNTIATSSLEARNSEIPEDDIKRLLNKQTLDSTEDTNNTVNNTVIHQISKPVIETCNTIATSSLEARNSEIPEDDIKRLLNKQTLNEFRTTIINMCTGPISCTNFRITVDNFEPSKLIPLEDILSDYTQNEEITKILLMDKELCDALLHLYYIRYYTRPAFRTKYPLKTTSAATGLPENNELQSNTNVTSNEEALPIGHTRPASRTEYPLKTRCSATSTSTSTATGLPENNELQSNTNVTSNKEDLPIGHTRPATSTSTSTATGLPENNELQSNTNVTSNEEALPIGHTRPASRTKYHLKTRCAATSTSTSAATGLPENNELQQNTNVTSNKEDLPIGHTRPATSTSTSTATGLPENNELQPNTTVTSNEKTLPIGTQSLERAKRIFFHNTDKCYSLSYLLLTTFGLKQTIIRTLFSLTFEEFRSLTHVYEGKLLYSNSSDDLEQMHKYVFKSCQIWPTNLFVKLYDLCEFLQTKNITFTNYATMLTYISPKFLHWSDLCLCTNFEDCVSADYERRTGNPLDVNDAAILQHEINNYYNRCWKCEEWIGATPLLSEQFVKTLLEGNCSNADVTMLNLSGLHEVYEPPQEPLIHISTWELAVPDDNEDMATHSTEPMNALNIIDNITVDNEGIDTHTTQPTHTTASIDDSNNAVIDHNYVLLPNTQQQIDMLSVEDVVRGSDPLDQSACISPLNVSANGTDRNLNESVEIISYGDIHVSVKIDPSEKEPLTDLLFYEDEDSNIICTTHAREIIVLDETIDLWNSQPTTQLLPNSGDSDVDGLLNLGQRLPSSAEEDSRQSMSLSEHIQLQDVNLTSSGSTHDNTKAQEYAGHQICAILNPIMKDEHNMSDVISLPFSLDYTMSQEHNETSTQQLSSLASFAPLNVDTFQHAQRLISTLEVSQITPLPAEVKLFPSSSEDSLTATATTTTTPTPTTVPKNNDFVTIRRTRPQKMSSTPLTTNTLPEIQNFASSLEDSQTPTNVIQLDNANVIKKPISVKNCVVRMTNVKKNSNFVEQRLHPIRPLAQNRNPAPTSNVQKQSSTLAEPSSSSSSASSASKQIHISQELTTNCTLFNNTSLLKMIDQNYQFQAQSQEVIQKSPKLPNVGLTTIPITSISDNSKPATRRNSTHQANESNKNF